MRLNFEKVAQKYPIKKVEEFYVDISELNSLRHETYDYTFEKDIERLGPQYKKENKVKLRRIYVETETDIMIQWDIIGKSYKPNYHGEYINKVHLKTSCIPFMMLEKEYKEYSYYENRKYKLERICDDLD